MRIFPPTYQSGKSQEVKLVSKRLRKLKWHIEIQNDGETADVLTCRLNRGNAFFRPKVKAIPGGNVTAAFLGGSYKANFAGLIGKAYLLEVKPSRKAKGRRKRRTFLSTVTSAMAPAKRDGILARAETAK